MPANFTLFRIQILIFLRETTQNDHNRLLYKFENDQKKIGCVGSCGYAPASVKYQLGKKKSQISHCASELLLFMSQED